MTKTNAVEILAVPLVIIAVLLTKFKLIPLFFAKRGGAKDGAPGDKGPPISEIPTPLSMWNPTTDWPGEFTNPDGQTTPIIQFPDFSAPNMPRDIDLGDPNVIGTSGPIVGVNRDVDTANEWQMGMP